MISTILRRLVSAIPTLLILATLTFFLLRLAPGGPFDSDHAWPPEVQANILAKYELDQPVYVQFLHWAGDLLQGDLRESFQYVGRPVAEIIGDSLPISIKLGFFALLFSLTIGIPLGCIAAWKQNSWLDRSLMFFAVTGISLPSYLVATLLILVFAFWLDLLPPALFDGPSSLILPAVTLASRPLAMISRLTRTTMLEALTMDYIRTAHGKGVPELQVLLKHALKNSLIPVIALLGPLAANLLTGSFLVEIVFQLPGLGKYFVHAVLNRDYPLVMGVTLVYGVILIFSNLLADLVTAWADPRLRL
jgi:oligopeptide transport system permease protein